MRLSLLIPLLLLALGCAPAPVRASAEGPQECEGLGQLAYAQTADRDSGVTLHQAQGKLSAFIVRDKLRRPPLMIHDEQDEKYVRGILGALYTPHYAHATPDDVKDELVQACLSAYHAVGKDLPQRDPPESIEHAPPVAPHVRNVSQFQSQAECRGWAEAARGVAIDRDAGVEVEAVIRKLSEIALADFRGDQLMFRDEKDANYAGQMIAMIYANPDKSPQQAYDWEFRMCEMARQLKPAQGV